MRRLTRFTWAAALLPLALCLFTSTQAPAQFQEQRHALSDAERGELASGRDQLGKALEALKALAARDPKLAERIPDAEIYFEAVDRNLRQNLFFTPAQVQQARELLKAGTERAAAIGAGNAPWEQQAGVVWLGYRSAVDDSVQPFAVYVPAGYDFSAPKPAPLDVFLHGRGGNLNEITFLTNSGWLDSAFGTESPANLVLYPYGRGNNGWRFAGERDLFEALDSLKRRYQVDADRVSLRGFSMGGHGAWHVGLQSPGYWSVVSPGAGFVETKKYQKITEPLPPWEEMLLHLYDPLDYAANAYNVPILAYTGDKDPAIEQHQLMMKGITREGAPVREFIGKDTAHQYEAMARTELLKAMAEHVRRPDASHIDFVTYTLRYPQCKWLMIEGLERHWQRAEVRARVTGPRRIEMAAGNVTSVTLTLPKSILRRRAKLGTDKPDSFAVVINNDSITGGTIEPGEPLTLIKTRPGWQIGEHKGLRKRYGVTGPIDDALFGPVVAVTGTGTPWTPSLVQWSDKELARFREGWDVYFRGRLPERTDKTLTKDDIKNKNLYLFGDPGSNAYLKKILSKLPIEWTKDQIKMWRDAYPTQTHLPMMVFPNPENPYRYIVINSGFTFGREDWQGSNARQYPRLPDFALIRYDVDGFTDNRRDDTVMAGFFDDDWRFPLK